MDDKPIKSLDITVQNGDDSSASLIPRQNKKPAVSLANGTNGTAHSNGVAPSDKKRTASIALSDEPQLSKRPKIPSKNDDLVILDDADDGAILIIDD